jgi:hypothetical protein
MNLWDWLTKRALRLPAAKNSLSDLLGEDYADYFRASVRGAIDDLAGQTVDALSGGVISTLGIVDRVKRDLVFHMRDVIGRPLSDKVEAEIDRALADALKKLPANDGQMRAVIREALLKALRL